MASFPSKVLVSIKSVQVLPSFCPPWRTRRFVRGRGPAPAASANPAYAAGRREAQGFREPGMPSSVQKSHTNKITRPGRWRTMAHPSELWRKREQGANGCRTITMSTNSSGQVLRRSDSIMALKQPPAALHQRLEQKKGFWEGARPW